ncbi:DUF6412 domain-containing protein [Rhodococcus sp. G-MC3]|uniref:DUF6412 domain-containing protein n=1 Tax=Rhodococcus sp. G-MC3 TaxID=3046209 RepID=UPI0024BA89EA|nr:DUF6412 domain-containing protein [Rhodococcus sp. G-MC3]MDJ0396538.1 DUF6412 domain-containing protein [Rhodococcus sp. G-MC3]
MNFDQGRMQAIFGALIAVAVFFLVAVGPGPSAHEALLGLVVIAVATLGVVIAAAVAPADDRGRNPPAEETRLRGKFRRQHRPDSPGRPMPRAPGPVI